MVNTNDSRVADKSSIEGSLSEVETHLKTTGASADLLKKFELLKKVIANPEYKSITNFPVFGNLSSQKHETNLTNGFGKDLKTFEYNLLDYAGSKPGSLTSSSPPGENKGWAVSKSRRKLKMDNDKIEDYLAHLGKNLNLDLFQLSSLPKVLEQGPLVSFGLVLIREAGSKIHKDFNSLLVPVLKDIQDMYLPNPYHNALHAASVAHMSSILAKAVIRYSKLKPQEEFAFMLASLGHDVGHPGKTNSFLNATGNPLSLIYNDVSVLENYHCSLIFHILRFHSKFYDLIKKSDWDWIRKRVIQLVLATDMKSHFTHVNNVKNKREKNDFDIEKNDDDLWLLLVLCIKAADIGHNLLPWIDHLTWTDVLFEEFYLQGDEEKKLSMKPFMLFDREVAQDMPGSQLGFFNTFTGPLLNELKNFDYNNFINDYVLYNLNYNLYFWTEYKGKPVKKILEEIDESKKEFEIQDAFVRVQVWTFTVN